MFSGLTDKLHGAFQSLRGKKRLSDENIREAVREVRLALLEADVNYGVVKELVKRIKQEAVGEELLKAVEPGQQFVKIVHEQLIALMGGEETPLSLNDGPSSIMLCGLQGSGKTTTCAKLARYAMKQSMAKKPLLIACDLQRPAAISQLETLGAQIGVEVYSEHGTQDAKGVVTRGLAHAGQQGADLVIVDTAGRLHIDEPLMEELKGVAAIVKPQELLFVANASTGQDAVSAAAAFNERVEVTGTILTMLDSDARAGAAISIREVTGKPLRFEGIGEKIEDLQLFNPQSMADRILGMGDTINLVRQAQEHIDEEKAKDLEEKMRKASFTFDDYLSQMQMVKKMGSLKKILGMMPGMGKMRDLDLPEKEFSKVEAIIHSMTPKERRQECELVPSRRKRIASGSGTSMDEVNRLVKSFNQVKKLFKNMPNQKQMEKMFGGMKWQ